jgi:hypothetical protein
MRVSRAIFHRCHFFQLDSGNIPSKRRSQNKGARFGLDILIHFLVCIQLRLGLRTACHRSPRLQNSLVCDIEVLQNAGRRPEWQRFKKFHRLLRPALKLAEIAPLVELGGGLQLFLDLNGPL